MQHVCPILRCALRLRSKGRAPSQLYAPCALTEVRSKNTEYLEMRLVSTQS